ncbi:hypothetical protein J121_92 [Qipengyuania citrea LAMA 915]|uniref:Uncharacterized protein n=1 Tax=Qipengyuania citrea LAMA 915 TaxID=1306953 RepID=A0A0L1KD77_9SPHN|nr:hypothetical protein [Qipengyuania citrea]KNH01893.1 hypothetical protein J121_92 [Qipengyuania citrea LAMA 915]
MIDLNLGGACPRRSLVHVLPRAMVVPNVCAYEPLTGINFAVMACDGALRDSIPILANSVQDTGRPALIATFASKLSVCTGMTLFRPLRDGVEVGMVEPCLVNDGDAIMLVAADRSKLLRIDAKGELVERRVPKAVRNGEAIDRAWADLKHRMSELVEHTGHFPLASWEVHLEFD